MRYSIKWVGKPDGKSAIMGKRKYTAIAQCPLCKGRGIYLVADLCKLCGNTGKIEVGLTKKQYQAMTEPVFSSHSYTVKVKHAVSEGDVIYQDDIDPTIGDILDGQEGD